MNNLAQPFIWLLALMVNGNSYIFRISVNKIKILFQHKVMSAEVFNSSKAQIYSSGILGESTHENVEGFHDLELKHQSSGEGHPNNEVTVENSNGGLVAILGGLAFLSVGFCFIRTGYNNYKARQKQKQLEIVKATSQPKITQHEFDRDSILWF